MQSGREKALATPEAKHQVMRGSKTLGEGKMKNLLGMKAEDYSDEEETPEKKEEEVDPFTWDNEFQEEEKRYSMATADGLGGAAKLTFVENDDWARKTDLITLDEKVQEVSVFADESPDGESGTNGDGDKKKKDLPMAGQLLGALGDDSDTEEDETTAVFQVFIEVPRARLLYLSTIIIQVVFDADHPAA